MSFLRKIRREELLYSKHSHIIYDFNVKELNEILIVFFKTYKLKCKMCGYVFSTLNDIYLRLPMIFTDFVVCDNPKCRIDLLNQVQKNRL